MQDDDKKPGPERPCLPILTWLGWELLTNDKAVSWAGPKDTYLYVITCDKARFWSTSNKNPSRDLTVLYLGFAYQSIMQYY